MSYKYEDLTGQKFNHLTVLQRSPNKKPNKVLWICQCDCGAITETNSCSLKSGRTKSCGCLRRKIKDLTGMRFNHLTVIKQNLDQAYINRNPGHNKTYWLCKCDCGNYTTVRSDELQNGNTKSCGCIKSAGEEAVRQALIDNNIKFIREFHFNDLLGDKYPLKFDFAVLSQDDNIVCLIEYQGQQHYTNNFYHSTNEEFEKRQAYDQKKKRILQYSQYPLD